MSRALEPQRRTGGEIHLCQRRQIALLVITSRFLWTLATCSSSSRARDLCQFSHLLPIHGDSISFTGTSMTGSRTAGTTVTTERHLMVQSGKAGIVTVMSFAAAPLAEVLKLLDLLRAY